MSKFGRLKNHIAQGRFGKALRIQLRWGARRLRRALRREQIFKGLSGSYAKRMYAMVLLLAAVGGIAYLGAWFSDRWIAGEQALTARLATPDFDAENPILTALDSFGSSNRVQVILQTAKKDNLHPQKVDLDQGYLGLVMTLKDGRIMEYTLQNKRIDNFESGSTDYFTLKLPDTVSPFDISEYKLVLLPDAKGRYGQWHCASAQVAFLLGGERTLLAKGGWEKECIFSADRTSATLPIATESNLRYARASALYPYALDVCTEQGAIHTAAIKKEANVELGLMNGDTLYLDIETVGLEIQNKLRRNQNGGVSLSELENLGYNGQMTLRVKFLSAFEGAFYKDYTLDTPGKDDFELGSSSTFALELPEGASVFDITEMALLVHDSSDAWAPRMLRAYLRTDYGTTLELARLSDTKLIADRRTCVFRHDLIDTSVSPLKLDLEAVYSLPLAIKENIEKQYYTEITGVIYSMYFGEHNFYERQKLYYSQIHALYGGIIDEEA